MLRDINLIWREAIIVNNAELNLFEELSTSDLQNIVGGKRVLGHHIVGATVIGIAALF